MKDSLYRQAPLPAVPRSALLRRDCACRAAADWITAEGQLRSTELRSRPGRSFRNRREYIPVGSPKTSLFLRVPERTTRPRPRQPSNVVLFGKSVSEKESVRVISVSFRKRAPRVPQHYPVAAVPVGGCPFREPQKQDVFVAASRDGFTAVPKRATSHRNRNTLKREPLLGHQPATR